MTDIEISKKCKLEPIINIAKKINLEKNILEYGKYMGKIDFNDYDRKGKLILVTAMSPTPLGEGKTTVSIGLADALTSLGKNTVAVLREPSMGPVFGIKGGATGGGYSQVVPMENINLHFTGDFHAITSACNLLSAAIDNHIYFGNKLNFKDVLFKRCLDVNDRALREIDLGSRTDSFTITAASEIMSIFCLASDLDDLKNRLGNIIVGINSKGDFIYARDLKVNGAMTVLLKDAFKPNLVQTLEKTPVIIHGGPFANIAHGCNSVVATKTGLSIADYVVTEAGFGADLGAEKFLNIKCRNGDFVPNIVVLVCTIKALKYHSTDNTLCFSNLNRHINNLKKFNLNVIVCLNKFESDDNDDILKLTNFCKDISIDFCISNSYAEGSSGSIDLAKCVIKESKNENNLIYSYDLNDPLEDKIEKIALKLYHARKVNFNDKALNKISILKNNKLDKLPICIAKTQYSFSDNPKLIGAPENFDVTVTDVCIYNGAGFITVILGNMVVMPGLSKTPSYERIDYVNGEIIGLS